jgi:hypothetical protein
MSSAHGLSLVVGIIKMQNKTPTQLEFASLFRHEFRYVEDRIELPPLSPLLTSFYEAVPNCPWEYGCGYWNVFLNFYLIWDIRDSWFALFVEPHTKRVGPPVGNDGPSIQLDWILDVLDPAWRADWPEVDKNDGVQLVKLYAAAIKPHAREIFIPAVRPSEGLTGFSWYQQVAPRLSELQASTTGGQP